MPSRFHFALFRLAALVRLQSSAPQSQKGLMLVVDRDQTAWEHYLVAIWYVITMAAFIAEIFSISIVLAIPAAMLSIYPILAMTGLTLIHRNNVRLQSFVFMSVMTGAAVLCSYSQTWVRFAAWQFLALIALNAICAAVVFLLRDTIARVEASRFAP